MKNILEIPSFLIDTFSAIEDRIIYKSSFASPKYRFIFLVRHPNDKYAEYKDEKNRGKLDKPLFVEELEKRNIEYVYGNIHKYNFIHNYLLFRRLKKQYNLDAVITHFSFTRYYGMFFGKMLGLKTIYYEHMYWCAPGTRLVGLKNIFFLKYTDLIIAVSKFIADTFPTNCNVKTLYNAIDPKIFESPKQDKMMLREKLGLNVGVKIVVMVAAFRPEKRHDIALKVCERVLKERTDICFVFVGYGEEYGSFKEQILEKGLEENIVLTGHINNVSDYFEAADISMLTSLFEPFGYVVIESLINRRPIVVFDSGGPAEIVEDSRDGFVVPQNDIESFCEKIGYLLDNDILRKEFGEYAYQKTVSKFNSDTSSKSFLLELDNLLGSMEANS